jgi:acyl-CoA reductase-like NAD-dependent aldehyde dehydrogenase
MDPAVFNSLIDISGSPAARLGQADLMLERGRWAATVFDRYDLEATMRIVDAVAQAAHDHAGAFAEKTVAESGFGVAAHKKIKNELTAKPLVNFYRDQDYVNPRVDDVRKIVEIPRPAGVVFALTPSTNPIATINYKIMLCLMTRNAIVISPHPAVRETSLEAVTVLTRAAEQAGAPASAIQVLERPTIPLVDAFMGSDKTNVILATGGTPMVRAAYSSGNPAVGVGPGNAPVFVDETADIGKAAQRIVASKCFDNSVLCTNESVLITLGEVENQLKMALKTSGAYICTEDEIGALRRFLFHPRGFNIEAIGREATWIAQECGIRVPSTTKILVAPITQIGVEEPLSREKLCPVLSMYVAKTRPQAISQARAVLRLTGAGHSAAIHSQDEGSVMEYASAVEVYRVVVNAPCSQGAAGFATNLAPTFTIGTGFFGRSSIGENVGPQHLVHWTRVAYNSDSDVPFGNYHGMGRSFHGALPRAPADGVPGSVQAVPPFQHPSAAAAMDNVTKDALRRLIAAELRDLLRK